MEIEGDREREREEENRHFRSRSYGKYVNMNLTTF